MSNTAAMKAKEKAEQNAHFYVEQRGCTLYVRIEDGFILRADGMCEDYSPTWKVDSIYEARPFGRLTRISSDWREILTAIAAGKLAPTFKNGKARLFIGDVDHGSYRVQMDGIRAVYAYTPTHELVIEGPGAGTETAR